MSAADGGVATPQDAVAVESPPPVPEQNGAAMAAEEGAKEPEPEPEPAPSPAPVEDVPLIGIDDGECSTNKALVVAVHVFTVWPPSTVHSGSALNTSAHSRLRRHGRRCRVLVSV